MPSGMLILVNDNNLSFDFVATELSRGERWRVGRATWTSQRFVGRDDRVDPSECYLGTLVWV